MSEVLKNEEKRGNISGDNESAEADFRISQQDVRESMKTFVKGMSE